MNARVRWSSTPILFSSSLALLAGCGQESSTSLSDDPATSAAAASVSEALDSGSDGSGRAFGPGHELHLVLDCSRPPPGDHPPGDHRPGDRDCHGGVPPSGPPQAGEGDPSLPPPPAGSGDRSLPPPPPPGGRPGHDGAPIGPGGHQGGRAGGGRGPLHGLIWVYDIDGDGTLDDAERAALASDLQAGCEARVQNLIATYDQDGDGTLSDAEIQAAEAAIRAEIEQHRADAIQTYDTNGDGHLDDAERRAMIQDHRAQILAQFDTNGDGTIDASERSALAAAIREQIRSGNRPGHF